MMALARFLLMLVAVLAAAHATIAGLTGMDTDFVVAAVLTLAAVLCIVLLNQVEHTRNCRLEAGRRAAWGRRNREGSS